MSVNYAEQALLSCQCFSSRYGGLNHFAVSKITLNRDYCK